MTLISFVIALVIIGIVFYLVQRFIPMPEIIKTVLNIVLVLVVIFLLLALFGVMPLPFPLK